MKLLGILFFALLSNFSFATYDYGEFEDVFLERSSREAKEKGVDPRESYYQRFEEPGFIQRAYDVYSLPVENEADYNALFQLAEGSASRLDMLAGFHGLRLREDLSEDSRMNFLFLKLIGKHARKFYKGSGAESVLEKFWVYSALRDILESSLSFESSKLYSTYLELLTPLKSWGVSDGIYSQAFLAVSDHAKSLVADSKEREELDNSILNFLDEQIKIEPDQYLQLTRLAGALNYAEAAEITSYRYQRQISKIILRYDGVYPLVDEVLGKVSRMKGVDIFLLGTLFSRLGNYCRGLELTLTKVLLQNPELAGAFYAYSLLHNDSFLRQHYVNVWTSLAMVGFHNEALDAKVANLAQESTGRVLLETQRYFGFRYDLAQKDTYHKALLNMVYNTEPSRSYARAALCEHYKEHPKVCGLMRVQGNMDYVLEEMAKIIRERFSLL